jgi:hypothetical protein
MMRGSLTSSPERIESDRSLVVDELNWAVLNFDEIEPRCRAEVWPPAMSAQEIISHSWTSATNHGLGSVQHANIEVPE